MTRGFVLTIALLSATPLIAQDTPKSIRDADVELDLSVPSSPAFTVLGLTPETVTRPSSPRELAASLLNGVDSNGILQTGLAVDVAPYFVAAGRGIDLEKYRTNYMVRFLSRTQTSVATAKAASEGDKAVRASVGLKLTFWDRGDYRGNRDFQLALSGARAKAKMQTEATGLKVSIDPVQAELYNTKLDEKLAAITKDIREDYRKRSWNRSAFVVGAAPTWITNTGGAQALTVSGSAIWTSLAYGFEGVPALESSGQLIVHARYRRGDRIAKPDKTDEFFTQNSALVGARFRFGAADTNGSFEGVYLHTDPDGVPRENYLRMTGSGEHRLVENIWLHFAIGTESGRIDDGNHLFVLTTLNFGVGAKK